MHSHLRRLFGERMEVAGTVTRTTGMVIGGGGGNYTVIHVQSNGTEYRGMLPRSLLHHVVRRYMFTNPAIPNAGQKVHVGLGSEDICGFRPVTNLTYDV